MLKNLLLGSPAGSCCNINAIHLSHWALLLVQLEESVPLVDSVRRLLILELHRGTGSQAQALSHFLYARSGPMILPLKECRLR